MKAEAFKDSKRFKLESLDNMLHEQVTGLESYWVAVASQKEQLHSIANNFVPFTTDNSTLDKLSSPASTYIRHTASLL